MVDPQAAGAEEQDILSLLQGASPEEVLALEQELGAPQGGIIGLNGFVPPDQEAMQPESPEASYSMGQEAGAQMMAASEEAMPEMPGQSGGIDLSGREAAMNAAYDELNRTRAKVGAEQVKTMAKQEVTLREQQALSQKLLNERKLASATMEEEDRRISESGSLKHLNSMDYTIMLMKGLRGVLKGDPDAVVSAVVDAMGADVKKKEKAILESKRKYERKITDLDFESDQSKIDSDYELGMVQLELQRQAKNLTFAAEKASTEIDRQKTMSYVEALEARANKVGEARAGKKTSQAPDTVASAAKVVSDLSATAPDAAQVMAQTYGETRGSGPVYQAAANRAREIAELGRDSKNVPLAKFIPLMKEADTLPVAEAKALRAEAHLGANAEILLEKLDRALKTNEDKIRKGALVPFEAKGGIRKGLGTAGSVVLDIVGQLAPNTQVDSAALSLQQMNNEFFTAARPVLMKGQSFYGITEKEWPLVKPVEYKRGMSAKDTQSIYRTAMHNITSQLMGMRGSNRAELATLYKKYTREDYR